MKTISFILLAALSLTLMNCSGSKEDSLPPYLYTSYLKFVDADNNNLLEKADLSDLKKKIVVAEQSRAEVDKLEISYVTIENALYLKVSVSSLPHKRLKDIRLSIQSKELFDDEQSHILKTTWQWDNSLDNTPSEAHLDNDTLELISTDQSFAYFLVR